MARERQQEYFETDWVTKKEKIFQFTYYNSPKRKAIVIKSLSVYWKRNKENISV